MIIPIGSSCLGHRVAEVGDPVWDLATLFPAQGAWTERDYLALDANRLIELTDGYLEVLPMPTLLHQLIVDYLHSLLKEYIKTGVGGLTLFAPLPVKFRPDLYREPDIVYLSPDRVAAMGKAKYPQGADFVIEVVSEGDEARERDYDAKRAIYAEHGVSEYWIVDPEQKQITVLSLDQSTKTYREHGVFQAGQQATSVVFAGFAPSVDAVFFQPQA
ncbi:MAG: Uma2 family endonuclease [Planctomycetota bacterium]|nr:Uma2 family endonuclease [Planctomycetota bacterium]